MMARKKSSFSGLIVRVPITVDFNPCCTPCGINLNARIICGARPVASLDAARSGPAYQIGFLEVSGFSPMFVSPDSLYRARTGRISLDGLIKAKNAKFRHVDGSRTDSTFR